VKITESCGFSSLSWRIIGSQKVTIAAEIVISTLKSDGCCL
jgi:hypothetical protein